VAKLRRLLWNRLTRRELTALRLLAALDSAVLVATAHGALTGNPALVPLLLPTYSSLFLVLVATLAVFAERRLVSWWLAGGVLLAGPLAATVVLDLCRPGRAAP
jgi:hypothetical protein